MPETPTPTPQTAEGRLELARPAAPLETPAPESGSTPMEVARLALTAGALPGRPWGLPRLTARYDVLLIGLLLLVTLLPYLNVFRGEFVQNARVSLEADPRIRDLAHVEDIFNKNFGYPLNTADGLYRPLTTLSFLFNYTILANGLNPVGYHTVNWVLHALNTLLVFYLVTVVFRSTRAGFAAGALFGCHPICTEAVASVMGRSDLLMTTLVLLGLFAHLGQIAWSNRPGRMWPLRLMLWGLFFGALLAKETGVILLPLVMLFDWLFDWRRYTGRPRRDFGENLLRKFRSNYIGMFLMLIIYVILRELALRRLEPKLVSFLDNPLVDAGFIGRVLTAAKLVMKSLYLLVFPRTLSADYSFNEIPVIAMPLDSMADWWSVLGLTGILGIVFLAWWWRRRLRALTFWTGLLLLALLPELSLFSLNNNIFSEQWLYLPAIAACALVGAVIHVATRTLMSPWWALKAEMPPFVDVSETTLLSEHLDAAYVHRLTVRRRAAWFLYGMAIVAVTTAFGLKTYMRNAEWENDLSLWRSAAIAVPDSAKAHKQLAWALFQSAPDGSRIEESIAEVEKAIIILPDYEDAYAQLGHYLGVKADRMLAKERAEGKAMSPETRRVYLAAAERLQKAAAFNKKSSEDRLRRLRQRVWASDLKLVLGNHLIYLHLGTVFIQLGLYPQAQQAFTDALRIAPGEPVVHEGLGEALANLGKLEDAAVELLQALMLAPNRAQAWSALEFIYRKLAPDQSCIIRDPAGRPRLNTSVTIVQGNIERAFRSLVKALLDVNQRDLARMLAEVAVDQYGMPQADFGDLVRREIKREKLLK
ncbi:MAG: DUF1736 domain-containing protein [Verrucomicrobiae bacterium]|nr:DUF1736 domain-containing protein [Verrucomicrobiae bacterium]